MAGMMASAVVMVAVVVLSKAGLLALRWPWFSSLGTLVCVAVAGAVERGVGRAARS